MSDAADRPTALVQNVYGTSYDQTYGFGWSPASQLLTRTASNALYKWTTPTPGTTTNAYDGLGRDAAIVTAGGYDARGNLTGDGTASYQYDVENRLTQVVRDGTTVTLAYDPAGRLSTMTVPASTSFLYDSDRPAGALALLDSPIVTGRTDAPMSFRLAAEGDVAVLVLDRPPVNALDLGLVRALEPAVADLARARPKGLVLAGAGRAFSAGVDVRAFAGYDGGESDCLAGQAASGVLRDIRTSRALALRRTRSFRARAMRTTFLGLPASSSFWRKAA